MRASGQRIRGSADAVSSARKAAAMLEHGGPLAAILAALLWCPGAFAESWCSAEDEDPDSRWYWRVNEYPNPMKQPRYCNRYRASFVCDPDRVIGKKQADALDAIIERIRNETLCICSNCGRSPARGITLGVAIMEHVHRPHNKPITEAVRLFAETLRKQWGLGRCDDDILLLIATKDKQSHTLVGPAVSDVFPQEVADQIYLESRGHFANCDFYLGLESMAQSYFDMLRRLQVKGLVAGARVQKTNGTSAGAIVGIVFGVLAAVLLAVGAVLLMARRCDSPPLSKKTIPEAWRRMRERRTTRCGPQQPHRRLNNSIATTPPDRTAVVVRMTPKAPEVSAALITSGTPPPTPTLVNGRCEAAAVGTGCKARVVGETDISGSSDDDDEGSISDSEGGSSCDSVSEGEDEARSLTPSSAGTRATL